MAYINDKIRASLVEGLLLADCSRREPGSAGPKAAGDDPPKRTFIRAFFLGWSRSLPHLNQMPFNVLCGKEGGVDIALCQQVEAPPGQLL